ncbi:agamous-like MADS-box protein AGL23 [Papaver somniferum]|uniref:agamous-like MADS-box protein AGL23 n=1 Tax=Papaver somniferum TaxID=3469 RepID=UPI000E6FACCC|nr:agamous-like MADS-box protein AGL23 [Papaver somniferum]
MEMKKQRPGGVGRKNIKIGKIKDKSRLQVTFSKRRKGLFKKETELSVLTGSQIALIGFSPAGRSHVFGNLDLILDRFLNNINGEIQKDDEQQQRRCLEVERELEAENKRGVLLESLVNCDLGPDNYKFWWNTYVDGLSLDELVQMRSDMEQLQKCVAQRSHDLQMTSNNTASSSSSSTSSYEDKSLALMTIPSGNEIVDDDYQNEEMVNEFLFGFDFQEHEFGFGNTTPTDEEEITADMFSDDYY